MRHLSAFSPSIFLLPRHAFALYPVIRYGQVYDGPLSQSERNFLLVSHFDGPSIKTPYLFSCVHTFMPGTMCVARCLGKACMAQILPLLGR
jgi:hypothetical protein